MKEDYMLDIQEINSVNENAKQNLSKDSVVEMEHASFNGLTDKLHELIQIYMKSNDPVLQEWAGIYQLFHRRSTAKIAADQLVKAVQYEGPEDSEMFVAYRLLHAYGSYDQSEYGVLDSVLESLIEKIEQIKESPFEPFFRFRLSQLKANIYLRKNKVELARQELYFIIDYCPNHSYIASAYHTLGLSYLYEDNQKGMSALNTSLHLYKKLSNKMCVFHLQRSIIFFNNYWGVDSNHIIFSNHNTDIHERAHFEIRRGCKEKAIDILSKIDSHALASQEKGFYYYYKALAQDDIDLLYKSIGFFKKIEDRFTAHMVRLELYRRGERQATIEAAYN
jgi:succinate dehydrogenase flavin-adding protein (antitoxin of CptAB toxin-antitoxin module)